MKGQIMLKVFSMLMIPVCLFGIAAGIIGILDLKVEKKLIENEKIEKETQIAQLEYGLAALKSMRAEYEIALTELERGKADYETRKNAYEISKTSLDEKLANLSADKQSGAIDAASAAAIQAQLDALYAQLDINKTFLDEYELIKSKVAVYESGKAQVNAIIEKLSVNDVFKTHMATEGDPVVAANHALAEETTKKQSKLQALFYINVATIVAALFAFIASIFGIGAADIPNGKKITGGILLGFFSFTLAASCCAYFKTLNYDINTLLISALGAEALFSFLYEISVIRYKNILASLIGT